MSMLTVMISIAMVSLTVVVLLLFMIVKGVGIKNFIQVFKVKMKKRKGFGFIELHHETGYRELIAYQFGKDAQFVKINDDERYIYKRHCMAGSFFDVPTISYRIGEADPIDPRTGLQTVTSTKVLENMIAKGIRAETTASSPLEEFFKKHWKTIGIGIIVVVGGFLFVYMNMADNLAVCAMNSGKTVLVNASNLGK